MFIEMHVSMFHVAKYITLNIFFKVMHSDYFICKKLRNCGYIYIYYVIVLGNNKKTN